MAAHYFLVFFFKAVPTSELVGVFMGGGGGIYKLWKLCLLLNQKVSVGGGG